MSKRHVELRQTTAGLERRISELKHELKRQTDINAVLETNRLLMVQQIALVTRIP